MSRVTLHVVTVDDRVYYVLATATELDELKSHKGVRTLEISLTQAEDVLRLHPEV